MKRLSLHEIDPEPWKNGAGTTRTIWSQDDGDGTSSTDGFRFRISVAEIAQRGPFSVFPGIDRIAIVLKNGPLRLIPLTAHESAFEGSPELVGLCYRPIAFPGEIAYLADIGGMTDRRDQPLLCLNTMTRRGKVHAEIRVVCSDTDIYFPVDSLLFAGGHGWLSDVGPIRKHHGLLVDADTSIFVRAPATIDGMLIAISIYSIAVPFKDNTNFTSHVEDGLAGKAHRSKEEA
ncbi:MAG: HutD family protein [Proteobacteria bacterium]|nr:HutD family protein [Pseudomonadota bacterium]